MKWFRSVSSLQDFTPIPALHGEDADIDILFLQNKMRYLNPVDDPWFSAHKEVDMGNGITEYEADHSVSPLACHSQHQFCSKSSFRILCHDTPILRALFFALLFTRGW